MAFIVYLPITRVFFHADDFIHLFVMANRGFRYFLVETAGAHMYFVRNTILYLMFALFRFRPEPYMWLSFVTHVLTVGLFFRVAHALTKNPLVAALGAAAWGTSPLGSEVLGWHSVYGQQLSAVVLLIVIGSVARHSIRDEAISFPRAISWALLFVMGATCFGTGLAASLVAPVVVLLLLPRRLWSRRLFWALLPVPVLVCAMYWVYATAANTPVVLPKWTPPGVQPYLDQPHGELRPFFDGVFSIGVRAFAPIPKMLWHLVAFSVTALLAGFSFFPETPYPSLLANVLVALYFAALVGTLLIAEAAVRKRIVAMLLLQLAVYGMVAVGRANFFILLFNAGPAVSAKVSRYHYMAAIPTVMILSLIVNELSRIARAERAIPAAALACWTLGNAHSWANTKWKIDDYRHAREESATVRRTIDAAIDGHPSGSLVRIQNQPFLGQDDIEFTGWAGLFAVAYPTDEVRGRRVVFLDSPEICRAYSGPQDLRLSHLLVPNRPAP